MFFLLLLFLPGVIFCQNFTEPSIGLASPCDSISSAKIPNCLFNGYFGGLIEPGKWLYFYCDLTELYFSTFNSRLIIGVPQMRTGEIQYFLRPELLPTPSNNWGSGIAVCDPQPHHCEKNSSFNLCSPIHDIWHVGITNIGNTTTQFMISVSLQGDSSCRGPPDDHTPIIVVVFFSIIILLILGWITAYYFENKRKKLALVESQSQPLNSTHYASFESQ